MSVALCRNVEASHLSIRENYIHSNDLVIDLQTDFLSTKPYGIQKTLYFKTDASRSHVHVPLFNSVFTDKMKGLDKNQKELGDASNSFIMDGTNDHMDYVKHKFDKHTRITLPKTDESELIGYDSIDELKDKIKCYYPVRFLLSFYVWNYLGKKGVNVFASHIQVKPEETKQERPDDFI